MDFGDQIRKQRKLHNMSQIELSKLLNVSHQSVSLWENNKVAPDVERLIKLSHIFKISLDELVNGKNINHNKLWMIIGSIWVVSIILTFLITAMIVK